MDNAWKLGRAIAKGSVEEVRSLLNEGVDPNGHPELGQWPLLECLKYNQLEIAQLLLDKGADVNLRDSNGRNIIIHIFSYQNIEFFDMILKHGVEVNTLNTYGDTPLHSAIRSGVPFYIFIKPLLDKGANIDALSSQGETPLQLAVRRLSPELIQQLLEYKPINEIVHSLNLVELAVEIFFGQSWEVVWERKKCDRRQPMSEVIDKLMDYDFKVSEQLVLDADFLFKAVILGNYRLVEELLQRGAPILDRRDILEEACSAGHRDIVELLIKYKVDLENVQYALDRAIKRDHRDVVELLLDKIPRNINLLFYRAAECGSAKVLQFLLENESPYINVNSCFNGRTLLQISGTRNEATIEVLWNFGADLNYRPENSCEDTPLFLAFRYIDHYPVQALLRLGADVNQIDKIGREWTESDFFNDGPSKCKVVREHIAALHAAGLYVSEYCLSFMLEGGEDILAKYKAEIEIMKTTRIPNTYVPLLEILKCSDNRLAQYANNLYISEALNSEEYLEKFPNYAHLLQTKIQVGLRRRDLVDGTMNEICHLGHFSCLPRICIEYIISFLTTEELAIGVGLYRPREEIIIDDL